MIRELSKDYNVPEFVVKERIKDVLEMINLEEKQRIKKRIRQCQSKKTA